MNQAAAIGLGAIAGATVFLGLPVARMKGLPKTVQGFLNAFATGILVFLLWDILAHAGGPVTAALVQRQRGTFAAMAIIFAVGVGAGLLGLVYFNRTVFSHLRHGTTTASPQRFPWRSQRAWGCTTFQKASRSASPRTSARSRSPASSPSASRSTTSQKGSASRRR